jgi:hypothetical protein
MAQGAVRGVRRGQPAMERKVHLLSLMDCTAGAGHAPVFGGCHVPTAHFSNNWTDNQYDTGRFKRPFSKNLRYYRSGNVFSITGQGFSGQSGNPSDPGAARDSEDCEIAGKDV